MPFSDSTASTIPDSQQKGKLDPSKEGTAFAHQLMDGAATSNINFRINVIDRKLNTYSPEERKQALAAMDAELTIKGLLPTQLSTMPTLTPLAPG
jgi:hypothetical protein